MKKLILLVFPAIVMLSAITVNASHHLIGGIEDFYKHMTSTVKYPEKAKLKDLQGHSIILFTLADGKLSGVNIYAELGSGCDVEVLNQLLAYSNFKSIKNGKYALKSSFRLNGSTADIENENSTIPEGYTELNITIIGIPQPKTGYLNLNTESDQAANSFKIKWRGSSMPGKNPKIIIDNKEIDYNDLNTINPESIYSIDVLKGESAIAKYGVSAVNGVIFCYHKD
jgi:hypothetical protein